MNAEIVERKIEVNLRVFYDLKRKIDNIAHDTGYRRRLEKEAVDISMEVERLESLLCKLN